MADKPRLLDLFCSAGGAAMGYHRAGFDVTGVDIKPQKHYPFTFIQADALEYVAAHGREYDAIHASPPCQAFSSMKFMYNAKRHVDLIDSSRQLLVASGKLYVIENVPGAPLLGAYIILCGSMFRLGTDEAELRRHRHFETGGFFLLTPPCSHYSQSAVIGIYGGHGRDRRRTISVCGKGVRRGPRDKSQQFGITDRRAAMGIDWMNTEELSQAIPPAYTEYIGRYLLAAIGA